MEALVTVLPPGALEKQSPGEADGLAIGIVGISAIEKCERSRAHVERLIDHGDRRQIRRLIRSAVAFAVNCPLDTAALKT